MGHKYLKGTVRTVEFRMDRNVEIFIYHTWIISSLLKILQGFPLLFKWTHGWPSCVCMSRSIAPPLPPGDSVSHHTALCCPQHPLCCQRACSATPQPQDLPLIIKLLQPQCSFFTYLLDSLLFETIYFSCLFLVYFHYTISIIKSKTRALL